MVPATKGLMHGPNFKRAYKFFMMIFCVNFQGEAMVVYDDEAAAKAAIMWYNGM